MKRRKTRRMSEECRIMLWIGALAVCHTLVVALITAELVTK